MSHSPKLSHIAIPSCLSIRKCAFSFYNVHNGNQKAERGGVKCVLDKPINSVYHGKRQYLAVVMVIVIELSSGHRILKVEAIIIPIFQR